MTSLMPGHSDKAARFAAVQARGRLIKGKAQSAPQKEPGMKKEEVEEIDEGNKENKEKKNKYVASIIQKKPHPSVLPSLKYGRSQLKKEEVEQVDERKMTEPEMKERERIVKGMKKKLSGFKERYGERAKNVMNATATKQAMKD